MNNILQVFEYDTIRVADEDALFENGIRVAISESEFKQLTKYHKEFSQYYSLSYRSIKFSFYVGIIQVGKLIIEVLPKVERNSNKSDWSKALYKMIKISKDFRSKRGTHTNLHVKSGSILDLYFNEYLTEVENILHVSLRKKYRFTATNRNSVKGKILFSKDIITNHSNKAKAYCYYQTYDVNHEMNKILKYALELTESLTTSKKIKSRSRALLLNFSDHISDKPNLSSLDNVKTDRNTDYYETGLSLAKMIINNHAPTLKANNTNIISFMFDMNHLFEEFVYKALKRTLVNYRVERRMISYWNGKRLIPDILLTNRNNEDDIIVLDTKWKIPKDNRPNDQDLRQIFTYNEYFKSKKGALLYPRTEDFKMISEMFEEKDHNCSMIGLQFFNEHRELDLSCLAESLKKDLDID